MIKPLVKPTKQIMSSSFFTGHDFFPQVVHAVENYFPVLSLWTPVISVYFMDTQIWYALVSTIYSRFIGAFDRLREIQALAMIRSRKWGFFMSKSFSEHNASWRSEAAKFAQIWNEIITSIREEDLISDWEMELLLFSYSSENQLFLNILFPSVVSSQWKEQIRSLYRFLTIRESVGDVPTNLEAQRRIAFFTHSLFKEMPRAPRVREMLSFSVMPPYYSEETVYSRSDLEMQNKDGNSIILYLKENYPDEWNNFMERIKCEKESDVWESEENILQLRYWVSLRGQTLCRTVRGMMYKRRALKLLAFLDMANESDILRGYKIVADTVETEKKSPRSIYSMLEAVADMKFTCIATCQNYGNLKRHGDPRGPHATDILNLMVNNPSLRVAYIDEVNERDIENGQRVYYSVLVKAVDNLEQEIYRIKLPGPAKIGEGKPENPNHAIIFTRGEALQAIDMLPKWCHFHYGHQDVFDRILYITGGDITRSFVCFSL